MVVLFGRSVWPRMETEDRRAGQFPLSLWVEWRHVSSCDVEGGDIFGLCDVEAGDIFGQCDVEAGDIFGLCDVECGDFSNCDCGGGDICSDPGSWVIREEQSLPPYFSKHRPSGPMLSIGRNVRVAVRVCVRLFTFEVPFKRLFAPTSQSRMSKNFRSSESLGENNGKKWSQIWNF